MVSCTRQSPGRWPWARGPHTWLCPCVETHFNSPSCPSHSPNRNRKCDPNVPDPLVNSTVLKGKLRCTLFALCNVLLGLPEFLSRSPPLVCPLAAAILLSPLPNLGWVRPSLLLLLTASNLSLVSSHHPCSFCLCSVCHAQSEADLPVGSACWMMAFRKPKARRFSNTDLEETPLLHQVLVSDRRGSRSWSLVAQCEQREMLAPASSP